jgi:hypothetical protein
LALRVALLAADLGVLAWALPMQAAAAALTPAWLVAAAVRSTCPTLVAAFPDLEILFVLTIAR